MFAMSKVIERLEDMSQRGRLRVLIQSDGDVIVSAIQNDGRMADVEFCTPMSGGGGSRKTWEALHALAVAMQEDNADPLCANRRGPTSSDVHHE
jgi:hypothetical protein